MEPPGAARLREGYFCRGQTAPRFVAVLVVLPKHGRCSPVYPLLEWAGASSPHPHRAKAGWNKQEVRRFCRPQACALLGCFRPMSCCAQGDLRKLGECAKEHFRQPPTG